MGSGFFGVTDEYLGEADVAVSCRQIRVQRQRPLEFGDALVRPLRLIQDGAHDLMGQRIVRPLRKHLGYRRFGRREARVPVVRQIGAAHRIVDPPDLKQRVEVAGIDREGALEEAARLRHVFDVDPLVERRQSLKEEVHRIGIRYAFGPMRFGRGQFRPQLIGEAGDDLVLHFEEIGLRLVEAFRPEMLAAFGVDELDIDTHAAGVALDRPFEHIADPKLLADFPGVDILALEGEGGISGDHEGAAQARQVGGQVFGDAVGEVILGGVV